MIFIMQLITSFLNELYVNSLAGGFHISRSSQLYLLGAYSRDDFVSIINSPHSLRFNNN